MNAHINPWVTTKIPVIMGIINLSSHSFHNVFTFDQALKKAEQMQKDGANYIDVGAIATNPTINITTDIPSEQQECDLLIPFVEKIARNIDIKISVDTFRATVMHACVQAGAQMINDQHALTEPDALETAIQCDVPVCLMHCARAQKRESPEALLQEVFDDLKKYADGCLKAGMKKENIIVDPGFGGGNFNKTPDENFYLLAHLEKFTALGFPVLVGLSRKSFFGALLNKPVVERLSASLAGALIAAQKGAAILRVHDVAETRDVLRVWEKIIHYHT